MAKTVITLPWPPSLNRAYRSVKGQVLLSKSGRLFKQEIMVLGMTEYWPRFGGARLKVEIHAFPPNKARRDLDNLFKLTLDALENVVYDNDNQIDDLRIIRREVVKHGRLEIEITPMEPD